MTTRRDFLNLAGKSVIAAGVGLALPKQLLAVTGSKNEHLIEKPMETAANDWIKSLPHFGIGGVPLGNEFEEVTDEQAHETIAAAWEAGVRYFDMAPWYGLGLAERRFGAFLHNQKREDFYISTKVGKLLKASKNNRGHEMFPHAGSPNSPVYDYTGPGVRRSVEDSLQRLGIESIDMVFVHDLSSDFPWFDRPWTDYYDIAKKGAFPELNKMREEGLIKAWGLGVNTPDPILMTMRDSTPDVFLVASQYSLIDHENALHQLFPEFRKRNIKVVIGSSLNAGFISGSNRYNYNPKKPIPKEYFDKRDQLNKIAASYHIDLRTAALQFSSYPDVVASMVVGARTAKQIRDDAASLQVKIPADFWAELKSKKLIDKDAPTSMGHV
ncbi:aldo/keto reductase [Mucilaginibacter jinjuensis]|uniref:Aldo/keto reductase n=1 Tax=Mucilaginibacter jinjuensis TaxID=1176721 RepID=A0ABY7TFD2_9SPHI|nr:aldo/keto reductase [Mucilaginibacter jinjuensis]WCT14322.1 aldo/keto reductase [Mucilaginibacter jinjuensis]